MSLFEKFYEKAVEEPPDFLLVPQKAFEMTSEKIFLPSDYKKLYELLQLGTETKPVLLIGNPGTGKTIWLVRSSLIVIALYFIWVRQVHVFALCAISLLKVENTQGGISQCSL